MNNISKFGLKKTKAALKHFRLEDMWRIGDGKSRNIGVSQQEWSLGKYERYKQIM